jgi:hypothetical protein
MTRTKRKLDFTNCPNIDSYVGGYINNKKQGYGVYYYHNGDKYEGMFDDDKKNGNGVYVSISTGRKYSGTWKNDKMHGNGVMINKNEKYVGVWDSGKLIRKNWNMK